MKRDAAASVIPLVVLSAALFGASTPLAKLLLGSVAPIMAGALLYAGSGVGLLAIWLASHGRHAKRIPAGREWIWVALGIATGGILAPMLLMYGLSGTPAGTAALLMTVDGIFTALLAQLLFGEKVTRRVWLGAGVMLAATAVLAYSPRARFGVSAAAALIVASCMLWAVDNNATRLVSHTDALFLAWSKGLGAGAFVFLLARLRGVAVPPLPTLGAALAVGFVGYGVSFVLYILSLRSIGSARASTYFATAPFFGGAIAIGFLHESVTPRFLVAGALMAVGVLLVATESATAVMLSASGTDAD